MPIFIGTPVSDKHPWAFIRMYPERQLIMTTMLMRISLTTVKVKPNRIREHERPLKKKTTHTQEKA